jgi:S1-C subfamily serine protease
VISFWINPKNLEVIYNYGTVLDMNKKLDNMSNLLKISNNIKPWFSWGPVLNMRWEIIGINYAINGNEKFILPSKFLE